MNIELIKKYKAEFEHFLNGGKLLARTKENFIWNDKINKDIMWNFEIEDIDIIINDDYSELRKALFEGKTIQILEVIEQHVSDSSKDIYGWKDFKSFKPNSPFGGEIHNYRIKPEEPKFKAGDFVRCLNDNDIFMLDESFAKQLNEDCQDAIKWNPYHKELCWFTTRSAMLDGVNYEVLGYFNTIIGLDYTTTDGQTYRHCEPFLNKKPSWFND